MRDVARWLDSELAHQPYVAGERFTIADITAFCALEFARGLMKFQPGARTCRTCRPGATASPSGPAPGRV
jgi:glutathione S-transferase